MNKNASPEPIALVLFSSQVLERHWIQLSKIFDLFEDFFKYQPDTTSFNRALIVFDPKHGDTRTPEAFRPISLQKKGITKIPLVHGDQTSFLSGRCISENFLYAADILHCCHKLKAPTTVIKLDFRKAFDFICWISLLAIHQARGFPLLDCWSPWYR